MQSIALLYTESCEVGALLHNSLHLAGVPVVPGAGWPSGEGVPAGPVGCRLAQWAAGGCAGGAGAGGCRVPVVPVGTEEEL
ncbi:MAG: hypothetical protein KME26_27435 [Oscillatoria princeps RMCB-10]|jgi:hypothetical protein|nr:hypothetical protein [Oscillatoria princeps RMCB-10]